MAQEQTTNEPRKLAGKGRARQSKKQKLIRMLSGKSAVGVDVISRRMAWQQHTVRAALSGLRKAGYEVATTKPAVGKPLRYRIIATPGLTSNRASADAR